MNAFSLTCRFGRPYRVLLALLCACSIPAAKADTARKDLLSLVPPDAGVTVVVEDLRAHSREIQESPLFRKLRALPTVRAWEGSEKARGFRNARKEIESALGVSATTIRDDLLGDVFVLALHLPEGRQPDEATGLLLSRVRDRKALERMIAGLNASESASGTLTRVVEIPGKDGMPTIWNRRFTAGTKPDEWYATLADGTFAWSNSESMLRSALGRSSTGGGIWDSPRFRAVDDALPAEAIARVFLDPRFFERMADAEVRAKKADDTNSTPRQLIAALDYAGAALLWQDGPVLHVHESYLPEKIPAGLLDTGGNRVEAGSPLRLIPATAVAVLAWNWNAGAIFDAAISRIPETQRDRLNAAMTLARGLLLGKDPRREILPFVGPGVRVYLDAREGSPVAAVASIDLKGRPDVAQALENGLQSIFSLVALDPNRKGGPLRIKMTDLDGVRVTSISGGERPWSVASNPDVLVLGSDPDVVRRRVAGSDRSSATAEDSRMGRMRSLLFPGAENFGIVDLEAFYRVATARRREWARVHARNRKVPEAEALRDLDRLLELVEPFGGLFASTTVTPRSRSAHQILGLVGRGESKE